MRSGGSPRAGAGRPRERGQKNLKKFLAYVLVTPRGLQASDSGSQCCVPEKVLFPSENFAQPLQNLVSQVTDFRGQVDLT